MPTTAKKLLDAVRIQPLADRDEATAIAAATAQLHLARDKAALTRDERIEALKMEFELEIEELSREIGKNEKRLADWAVKNRKAEFGERKSITLAGHKLVFREGTGTVEYVPGVKAGDALDSILAAEDETMAERFVRVKPTLDKNAVLAAWRSSGTLREFLEGVGITVVKRESFTFEPDRDATAESSPVEVGKGAA